MERGAREPAQQGPVHDLAGAICQQAWLDAERTIESVEQLDDSMEGKQQKEERRAIIPQTWPYRQEHSVDVRPCYFEGNITHYTIRPGIAWFLGISCSHEMKEATFDSLRSG